jgi:methoxymalonate biosynthesis acyl carrier protein
LTTRSISKKGECVLLDIIKNFLSRFFNLDSIKDDTNFFELGLVNSLFAMQLVSFIENQYDIEVDNKDIRIENFCSVNAIKAYIDGKI